ncbi:unnamed protein product [Musa acuminata subsp. burmannicoides]
MSKFLDDSDSFPSTFQAATLSPTMAMTKTAMPNPKPKLTFFRTSSPVSVLEDNTRAAAAATSSSSSSSSSWTSASYGKDAKVLLPPISPPEAPSVMAVPARARSKRPRPAASRFAPRHHPYLPPSSDAVTEVHPLSAAANSDPESFGESCPRLHRRRKQPEDSGSHCRRGGVGLASAGEEVHALRDTEDPQWRAGPMGPKTLCNACGVRYKSAAFPEYRPAASPTFVPSIHPFPQEGGGDASPRRRRHVLLRRL